jgi:hypothetical protein
MKPSDFKKYPYDSIFKNNEHEVVAENIMIILSKTGNIFRLLSWAEYVEYRLKDGNFKEKEKYYFDKVLPHTVSEQTAKDFSPNWRNG